MDNATNKLNWPELTKCSSLSLEGLLPTGPTPSNLNIPRRDGDAMLGMLGSHGGAATAGGAGAVCGGGAGEGELTLHSAQGRLQFSTVRVVARRKKRLNRSKRSTLKSGQNDLFR